VRECFPTKDVRSLAKSAVIGQTVADQLFPNENRSARPSASGISHFLSSACWPPKSFNLFGQDQDDTVVVPYTSTMHALPPVRL